MLYNTFKDTSISRLGFGTMRLPVTTDGAVDEAQVAQMVQYALEHGVNYFDTAYPYHGGHSETVIGRALRAYPRERFLLADKFPAHQICSSYEPAPIFEEQLVKCGVDFFDFYLLHNVCESSIDTYCDPQWGIVDYFVEQHRLGRIRHLGFSSHAELPTLTRFLDLYGQHLEFCQIQLNYVDWTLQHAREKCALLNERHIPIWVMEPVRGGKLAQLPADAATQLNALRPQETAAAWAFRWLQGLEGVTVILSGMSNLAQMQENVRTFEQERPLSQAEETLLLSIGQQLQQGVPCTGCRYCCDGCPMGLDIPLLLATLNDARFQPTFTPGMRIEFLPSEKQPSACLACGACAQICPQHIDIPSALKELTQRLQQIPNWTALSRQREEEALRNRQSIPLHKTF